MDGITRLIKHFSFDHDGRARLTDRPRSVRGLRTTNEFGKGNAGGSSLAGQLNISYLGESQI